MEADVYAVSYKPRKGERIKGKLGIVLIPLRNMALFLFLDSLLQNICVTKKGLCFVSLMFIPKLVSANFVSHSLALEGGGVRITLTHSRKTLDQNNAGKKPPAATAPMANAYANATILKKIENLAATFRHRKCNETSSRFLFLIIKGNDKSYQTPYVLLITEQKKSQCVRVLPKHVFRKHFGRKSSGIKASLSFSVEPTDSRKNIKNICDKAKSRTKVTENTTKRTRPPRSSTKFIAQKTKLYDPTLDDQYKLYFLAPRSERSHSLAPRLTGIRSHSAWSRPSRKSPRNRLRTGSVSSFLGFISLGNKGNNFHTDKGNIIRNFHRIN
ncbi:hypothetical protein YC2023_060805 [Brassica napus]